MQDGTEPFASSAGGAQQGAVEGYRVLARKYRPRDFSGLIGQEALVRTLRNAIAQGRLAHGFMLTGVRGVGKTTTARILARCFNCIGPDGQGGPTAEPCGQCEHCRAIAEDRHVDVIEMDAASNTGVSDVRQIIDAVRYTPVSARFKVYIIDEVHMLSTQAFNALLKTLEEPPEHVKFIFATTEIRKVPVTVLSRCQRFDLRRISAEELTQYFLKIAAAEGARITEGAAAMIARAADGSARDGLSLLDQAIALSHGEIDEAQVRDMLGLADRTQLIDLYDDVLKGKAAEALKRLQAMHQAGADAAVVLQDMLELTHWLTRAKITPEPLSDPVTPEAERAWGAKVTPELSIPVLARLWQMLLKGLSEVQAAPQPLAAAEMVLIRLMHAANMPDPADLVRRLGEGNGAAAAPVPRGNGGAARTVPAPTQRLQTQQQIAPQATQQIAPSPAPRNAPQASALPQPQSFSDVVALFHARREAILAAHLQNDVHLVQFEVGRIDFRPGERAPSNLPNRVAACLAEWTGKRWLVSVSAQTGEKTLKEQAAELAQAQREEAARHPLVQAVLAAFPGATIDEVRNLAPEPAADATISPPGDLPNVDEPIEDEIA
ncbi:DNA polymerase III subunit gamma/tau [Dongia deserti]|uniref:DNA polymerase III subunit gamma/tau n=1 Tax=Dongia deserti TaxID=2268030 RepID=UPI000E6533D5|nr:DNA polymerase III subunit gamma/tau [Dongia deserti]